MFSLVRLTDLVILPPNTFRKPTLSALEDLLNQKFSNRVLHRVGLCILLYDILSVGSGIIGHGSGGSCHVHVAFRMVVFRPYKGEILMGRISSSSIHGINVRLDFFHDIFIPQHYLFEGSDFDPKENVWVWRSEGSEFWLDKNEVVRFRVEEEAFEDQLPVPPHLVEQTSEVERKPPYRIIGSIQQAGMGMPAWWAQDEEEEEGEGEGEAEEEE